MPAKINVGVSYSYWMLKPRLFTLSIQCIWIVIGIFSTTLLLGQGTPHAEEGFTGRYKKLESMSSGSSPSSK